MSLLLVSPSHSVLSFGRPSRARKMARVVRTLGEQVPPALVFRAKRGSLVALGKQKRRRSRLVKARMRPGHAAHVSEEWGTKAEADEEGEWIEDGEWEWEAVEEMDVVEEVVVPLPPATIKTAPPPRPPRAPERQAGAPPQPRAMASQGITRSPSQLAPPSPGQSLYNAAAALYGSAVSTPNSEVMGFPSPQGQGHGDGQSFPFTQGIVRSASQRGPQGQAADASTSDAASTSQGIKRAQSQRAPQGQGVDAQTPTSKGIVRSASQRKPPPQGQAQYDVYAPPTTSSSKAQSYGHGEGQGIVRAQSQRMPRQPAVDDGSQSYAHPQGIVRAQSQRTPPSRSQGQPSPSDAQASTSEGIVRAQSHRMPQLQGQVQTQGQGQGQGQGVPIDAAGAPFASATVSASDRRAPLQGAMRAPHGRGVDAQAQSHSGSSYPQGMMRSASQRLPQSQSRSPSQAQSQGQSEAYSQGVIHAQSHHTPQTQAQAQAYSQGIMRSASQRAPSPQAQAHPQAIMRSASQRTPQTQSRPSIDTQPQRIQRSASQRSPAGWPSQRLPSPSSASRGPLIFAAQPSSGTPPFPPSHAGSSQPFAAFAAGPVRSQRSLDRGRRSGERDRGKERKGQQDGHHGREHGRGGEREREPPRSQRSLDGERGHEHEPGRRSHEQDRERYGKRERAQAQAQPAHGGYDGGRRSGERDRERERQAATLAAFPPVPSSQAAAPRSAHARGVSPRTSDERDARPVLPRSQRSLDGGAAPQAAFEDGSGPLPSRSHTHATPTSRSGSPSRRDTPERTRDTGTRAAQPFTSSTPQDRPFVDSFAPVQPAIAPTAAASSSQNTQDRSHPTHINTGAGVGSDDPTGTHRREKGWSGEWVAQDGGIRSMGDVASRLRGLRVK
ncbi:hypothetical protein DFH06DRAFT_188561 [Mycena polygramma]|nr:hypothetical protein DFH06DRAFT_188561 [Mycena polygramma]